MAELYEEICSEILKNKVPDITMDSREVEKDFLFCAPSEKSHSYIEDALKRGAKIVLTKQEPQYRGNEVKFFFHSNPREIYHRICSFLWNKQPEYVCAATGTNGKTSISSFFSQICVLAGEKAASLGTLGVSSNVRELNQPLKLTTPDAADLHKLLDKLAQSAVQYCCLEASSQGIEQKRLDSVRLKAVAFSNLTHEHLDYHENMDKYFQAKLRLFSDILPDDGTMVLPTLDEYAVRIRQICPNKHVVTYGNTGDIQIISQLPNQIGQVLKVKVLDKELIIPLKVFGKFQGNNLIAAIGLALSCGIDVHNIEYDKIVAPIGRMEFIKHPGDRCKIMIDYAHTPDGLQHLLLSLKWHFPYNDITLVFGCGGDRDKQKRPLMARIASKMTSKVIITDDNPRSEAPEKIRKELLHHCPKALEIDGRQNAIKYAIRTAKPSEIIVITGRGHESKQVLKDRILHISDVHTIQETVTTQ
ncbi:Mur ligase family protein [Neorickettsia helminthoeca]|nr:UDP-N-acetylmuramoyl-L-alanyl-D-glutamate--2,6-diaminopimelate ligase [Neorickettsia helminthoeca]